MKDFDDFVERYLEMLPTEGVVSDVEAQRRASEFLVACSHLVAYKHQVRDELIKAKSVRDASYAQAMANAQGSNAPTREANASADPMYMRNREEYESAENRVYTIQTYYDIFFNAHVFYRQLSKENGQ